MDLSVAQVDALESVIKVGYDGSVSDRAQIVLWRSRGYSAAEVAAKMATTKPTVYLWERRFASEGLAGLVDRKSTGRPRTVDEATREWIVEVTLAGPPESTGLSHWSSTEMSKYLKRHEGIVVSHNFIAVLWREHGLKPHRQGTFKISKDPEFAAKVVDVVGLYLDPPEGAIVVSVDEKSQIQALDRTQPMLPMDFDRTEQRTHDYRRHGVTNLFAAIDVLTGRVAGRCYDRRGTNEFLTFMNTVVRGHRDTDIHVVLDNLSTHKGERVDTWLAKHPNVTFHYTPIGSSWINQIETWFGIITDKAIRRGTFGSVAHLVKTIDDYIRHWNTDARPFTWTATPEDILEKVAIVDRQYRQLVANNT